MFSTVYNPIVNAGFNWAEIIKDYDIDIIDIQAFRPGVKFNSLAACDQYEYQGVLVRLESEWTNYQEGRVKFFITDESNEFVVFSPNDNPKACYVIYAKYWKTY